MNQTALKVLSVSQNYYVRGGSDRIFLMTNELLEKQGHRAIPFAAEHPKNQPTQWTRYFPVAANFERPGPIDLIRFVYSRPAAQSIRRLIRDHKPDIAHLHIYYGKLTGSILAPLKAAGIPIVQTLHEYKLICPTYTLVSNGQICEACQGRHFWRAIPRRCNRNLLTRTLLSTTEMYVSRLLGSVRNVDHFVAVSDALRAKMIEHGIAARKISTVHNSVDVSAIPPNHQPGEYLLYFGRLERLKGLFTLLEAVAPLTQTPLLIVGDGEARDELSDTIERRNLKHVQLLGFKQGAELEQLVRGSISTLVPSEWYEPFPTTVLESFAHSRPVIASRIGGITEMITEGRDGFLVEPGNAQGLQERMAWMASHRNKAVSMGLAGRKKVEEEFSPQVYYRAIMRVYNKLL